MVIVTHDLPYAAQLCDRAIVLDGGVVVADDTVTAVLADSELLAATGSNCPGVSPSSTPERCRVSRRD